ncbi:MAG: lysophospholipid acyltransferase family protein [Gemmatimonadota bacterium]|nr:lysophospholipid acyltransferase family protein [Gemmatimonadota bacterium]
MTLPSSEFPPLQSIPPLVARRGGPVRRWIGRSILRLLGWRMVGALPDESRFVIIAAPHTSNMDFIVGMSLIWAQSIDARWIGKQELFRGPMNRIFRRLGGIPVDRHAPGGVVDDAVAAFRNSDRMVLAIAPEGTRKSVTRWKSGFHRIAFGADVPVVCGFFDRGRKLVGFGPTVWPTGDLEADIQRLRRWYGQE